MCRMFPKIWLKSMVNVGKHDSIHGAYGHGIWGGSSIVGSCSFGFDLVGWHTSKEKSRRQHEFFNHKSLLRLLSSTTCLVSVQKCEAVKVRLLHYMTIFVSGYCTSFRVRERTNFFEINNSVKQLTLEGVNNECPMDHIARTG